MKCFAVINDKGSILPYTISNDKDSAKAKWLLFSYPRIEMKDREFEIEKLFEELAPNHLVVEIEYEILGE